MIGAFLGTYFTLSISIYMAKYKNMWFTKLFIYLGKNTLPIVIWHFLAFRITIILQIVVLNISIKELVDFPIYDGSNGWWVVYIVSGIGGSLVWNYIIKHNLLCDYIRKNCFKRNDFIQRN